MLNNRIANVADMLKNYHLLILPNFVAKDEWWGGRIIDVEQPVKFVKVGLTFEGSGITEQFIMIDMRNQTKVMVITTPLMYNS